MVNKAQQRKKGTIPFQQIDAIQQAKTLEVDIILTKHIT